MSCKTFLLRKDHRGNNNAVATELSKPSSMITRIRFVMPTCRTRLGIVDRSLPFVSSSRGRSQDRS
jgi:hypothetical protein